MFKNLAFMIQNNAFLVVKTGSLPKACRDSLLILKLGLSCPTRAVLRYIRRLLAVSVCLPTNK
jgi:hypothetical protein